MAQFVAVTDSPTGGDLSVEKEVLAGLTVEEVTWNELESLTAAIRHADAILCMHAPLTDRVIRSLVSCKVIVRYGTGLDNIDRVSASAMNIPVFGVDDYCTQEVANHAMAFVLSWNRKLFQYDDFVRSGRWRESAKTTGASGCGPVTRLSGQVLGIVGFGRIARALASRALSFGMKVLVNSRHRDAALAKQMHIEFVDLDDLLQSSDFVSLNVPLVPETQRFINAEKISLMKPTAVLMNTARGKLVDEVALAEALRSGRLGGAMLDVYEHAPVAPNHPFVGLKNVILTPHVAFYSEEALTELRRRAADVVRLHLTA